MKKILCFLLAALTVVCLPVAAYAAELTDEGSETQGVTATYNASAAEDVFSVTIEWGAMSFTYYKEEPKHWDAEKLEWVTDGTAGWNYNNSNTITVTNKSSTAVTASFTYTAASGYEAIQGTFSQNPLSLGIPNGAPTTGTVTLTLEGGLPETAGEAANIGTVTVNVSKAEQTE